MSDAIEIKNLVKRYKEVLALDHFNLQVKEGEIFGLLGPNGSGKTTAINCILSLLQYDKGEIKVFGKEMLPDSYESKRNIGVVMQNVAVFEELSVYENVDYFCGLYIKDKKIRKQYVEEAISFVGLEEYVKFLPKKLSGGLLRRLNIACGIDTLDNLVFAVGDAFHSKGQLTKFGYIQFYNVSVDYHFADIGTHILNACLFHFLFY